MPGNKFALRRIGKAGSQFMMEQTWDTEKAGGCFAKLDNPALMRYITAQIEGLVNIPSPSGYTGQVMEWIEERVRGVGFAVSYNRKGGMLIEVPGKTDRVLGLSAHVDTLGAMVRSVRPDGRLAIVSIGGFMMQSVEGSYCKVLTRDGREFTGTVETVQPSVHTWDDPRGLKREEANMAVNLDEIVRSREDVEDLGVGPGDFVAFEPKFQLTAGGFIKSRHLDDKASAAVLLGLLKYLHDENRKPEQTLIIALSNYEEVGHGCSFIPEGVEEFLALDMGALGDDLSGDEYKVSICAKDSSGPYDFAMTNRLIALAKEYGIDYAVDIFPHYGSDVSAALKAGRNIRGALIGQGVWASHGQERTHLKGLEQTFRLLAAYTGVLEQETSRGFYKRQQDRR